MFRPLGPAHVALVVVLVTAGVWSTGLAGGYHFDDAITPVSDPASQSLGAFVRHLPDTLRPATKLTYAIEASLGLDDAPEARRGVDVAIHASAAALLCLLLVALGATPRRAGVFALVWSVHPIHAESVLAIAGRTGALSTALVLAALLAHRRDRVVLGAVLLGLAGLARETALATIVPLVVLELTTDRPRRDQLRRLVPAVIATALVAVWIVATPRVRELAAFSYGRPVGTAIAHQLAAIPVGASLYVRTWALSIDHGEALPAILTVVGVAMLVAAVVVAVAVRRRAPNVALGLALWFAAIAPTQTVVPKLDPLTERPLAFALVGLVVVLAAVIPRRATWLAAPIVVGLGIASVARGRLYRSDLLLWADASEKSVTNARPVMNHAYFLFHEGQLDDARRELDRAHEIAPEDVQINVLRHELGRGSDAL
jgi:hypothetical protein